MANIVVTTFELSSGFTVSVQPLPPYYIDFINDELPMLDYPKRKIALAGGDTLEIDYTPSETQPDVNDTEEYELYVSWHSVNTANKVIQAKRERSKRDYVFASCVTVDDGPFSVDDEDWVENIKTVLDTFVVPTQRGKRKLAFLKACVIRTLPEYEAIIKAAVFPEVTMQGIQAALHGFRNEVGQQATGRSYDRQGKSSR